MHISTLSFMKLIALGCILIRAVQGQEPQLTGTLKVTSPDPRGRALPRWNGSGLGFRDYSSVAHFVDSQGTPTPIALTIPDATEVHIRDVGHRSGEAFVLIGWAADRDKRIVNFLAFAYSDNRPTRVMRTDPYGPMKLAVAQDGSFWTYGSEQTTPGHLSDTDAGMIRRFDASGNPIGSYLPQSSIDKKEDMRSGFTNFAVASNRAGWYNGYARFYFEIADGNVHKYPAIPESACDLSASPRGAYGLALTDNGGVFVSQWCGKLRQVYSLDRASKQWSPVSVPNGDYQLVGGYGNHLVFHSLAEPREYNIYDVSQWSPH